MADLIDRQAAIDALMVAINDVGILDGDDIRAVFDNLPSAQPTQEIIHCKDCKYWKEKPLYTYCEKMYRMGILDVLDYATEENDFCSMAEKKGEAE